MVSKNDMRSAPAQLASAYCVEQSSFGALLLKVEEDWLPWRRAAKQCRCCAAGLLPLIIDAVQDPSASALRATGVITLSQASMQPAEP